jgi:hypothetical protein
VGEDNVSTKGEHPQNPLLQTVSTNKENLKKKFQTNCFLNTSVENDYLARLSIVDNPFNLFIVVGCSSSK